MSTTLELEGQPHTLSDQVFNTLRDAIIDGRLESGQWLRQEALAQELGLSQMPVREALKRLVAEGLAERIPYRGVRVIEFGPEDIMDMVTLRLVLESLAVRYATPLITEEDLAGLRENLCRAAALTAPEQMGQRRKLNTEFHLTICRASGHRYLIGQIETLWGWFPSVMLYEGLRHQKTASSAWLARETEEHQAMLAALVKRDEELAERETQRHFRTLAAELSELLALPLPPLVMLAESD